MKTKPVRQPASTTHPAVSTKKHPSKAVRFKFSRPDARAIASVGSFTEWQARPISLEETEPGLWEVEIDLTPGRHEYLLLSDEGEWLQDPAAIESVANPWGGLNSVVVVELEQPR